MDKDMETLEELKRFKKKKGRSFESRINSKDMSNDDMDEMFLGA
jgi:hypothetical protein